MSGPLDMVTEPSDASGRVEDLEPVTIPLMVTGKLEAIHIYLKRKTGRRGRSRLPIAFSKRNFVFLAGRAQRDRREMISNEIFSVQNMASGVFIVASFPDFFSQF